MYQEKMRYIKEKQEAAERERQRLDEEEARIQEELRREAIDKANRLLFYNNDSVKAFHSALLASDVAKVCSTTCNYCVLRVVLRELYTDPSRNGSCSWN